MRLLGTAVAAAAAAVESRLLPRVPAALGWQWKQVVESGGATPHHGLSPGPCGVSGAREDVTLLPSLAPPY